MNRRWTLAAAAAALLGITALSSAQDTNANLSGLGSSVGLTPDFDSATVGYTANVPYATGTMILTPTAAAPAPPATITYSIDGGPPISIGSGVASGPIPLGVGDTVIATVVTAEDTNVTKTYTLTVTRAAPSTNADLSNFESSVGFTPTFDTSTPAYTASVPFATGSVTVTPTKADAGATITYSVGGGPPVSIASGVASAAIALGVGDTVITTEVRAEDAVTTKTYTLTVTRDAPSTNSALANLESSVGLSPTFDTGTLAYTASVAYPPPSMTVTPTAADVLATIKVNGVSVASGSASASISLIPGANSITTVVTAENATTTTYTLTVTVTVADPVAIPGGPYTVFGGGTLVLNGSASLASDGNTITLYEWDLDNDGDYEEAITGATPAAISDATLRATYGMSFGGNTIKLRVTDTSFETSVTEATVNILPPVAVVYEPFNYPGTALNGRSGTSEVGLTGTWTASADSFLGPNRAYGPLVTRGAGIGNLQTGVNRFGGRRDINAAALAGNGLLADGATLWFSVILGYDTGGNPTNTRLGFCLATEGFSTNNFAYYFATSGATGIGVTLGNFGGNGKVVATQFRDSTFGGSGFGGNIFATNPNSSPVLYGVGQSGLIVGKITWGAVNDTIELYNPGVDLILPATPISTLTVSVAQSAFDTLTWSRGDKIVMDEIRFGGSYPAVIETGSAWDLNGDVAGAGFVSPSSTWNADAIWNLAPDGTLVPIPWQAGGVATFSAGTDATGPYAVTVDGTQDIGGLSFEDGTVTISGGTALRMAKDTTVSVNPGLTASIATALTEDAPGRQFAKAGAGTLVLSGDNVAATSGMNLSAGVVEFESPSAINGTARNVTIGSGGTIKFSSDFGAGNIPTALLGRVVASSAGAITADNYDSTNFDFSAAGLTAARLGAVGNVTYTGTLTQNGTAYRLGGGGGTLTMANTNALTGIGNTLTVNGNVTLAGNNDYTGVTTIIANSTVTIMGSSTSSAVTLNTPSTTLTLGNNASLGLGTLTVANSFAGPGTLAAIGTVVTTNPVTAGTDFNFGGTGALTLGTVTVSGARTITNNNTTNVSTITSITSTAASALTFAGNGSTTVSGVIGGGSGISTLTKNGNGTLTLRGVNTNTGATAVNEAGTLLVASPGSLPAASAVTLNNTSTLAGNGTISGNVTVTATANIAPGNLAVGTLPITGNLTISAMAASTGTLRYELGPIAASDKITVGGTLTIGTGVLGFNNFVFTGLAGLELGTYKLIAATTGITGSLDVPANLSGPVGALVGTLQITGKDLELVVKSPYAHWSGGVAADIDTNGDSVKNGVAWAVGAANPAANAIGLVPTLDNLTDPDFVIFNYRRSDAAAADAKTTIQVQYGSDLVGWNEATAGPDIVITPSNDFYAAGIDKVEVKIRRTLAVGGTLFARLRVVVTAP